MKKRKRNIDPNDIPDFKKFVEEMQGESDRGAALVGAALLDDLLNKLLAKVLRQDKNLMADLFRDELQTFSNAINITYALGLINISLFNKLNVLREIRNEFAHNLSLTFDTENIKACIIDNFAKNDMLKEPLDILSARMHFICASSMAAMELTIKVNVVNPFPMDVNSFDASAVLKK